MWINSHIRVSKQGVTNTFIFQIYCKQSFSFFSLPICMLTDTVVCCTSEVFCTRVAHACVLVRQQPIYRYPESNLTDVATFLAILRCQWINPEGAGWIHHLNPQEEILLLIQKKITYPQSNAIIYSPPSAACLSLWIGSALAPSHYLNQCWVIVNWTLRNKLKWKCSQNTKLFIHKNVSETIVCEMTANLARGMS